MALLCLGPSAADPVLASIPASASCQADAELTVFDQGSSVICLQFALGMMHFFSGPISGVFDQGTLDAVTMFQATHPPLRVDGRAGPRTLEALGIWSGKTDDGIVVAPCRADATIQPGQRSNSVRCLQDALRELGLYDGATNGVSDLATVDALMRYQRATPPLKVDGWAGPRTLAAMGIWSGNASGGLTGSGFAPEGPWPAPMQNEPLWNLTPDGLPVYGNRTPCSRADANMIAFQFANDGADIATQQWAVYIATREGGCRFDAVNVNPTTLDDSHCSFQLNALSGMFAPTASLGRLGWTVDTVKQSMANCANAASDLWVFCGRGPWTPPYSCKPPWGDPLTGVPADGDG